MISLLYVVICCIRAKIKSVKISHIYGLYGKLKPVSVGGIINVNTLNFLQTRTILQKQNMFDSRYVFRIINRCTGQHNDNEITNFKKYRKN